MGRLVDQSPSMSCSVVDTVPRMSNGPTSRPVPEHVMLGVRYSPQDVEMCRLVDQSPSMSCSVVGTVPNYIMFV